MCIFVGALGRPLPLAMKFQGIIETFCRLDNTKSRDFTSKKKDYPTMDETLISHLIILVNDLSVQVQFIDDPDQFDWNHLTKRLGRAKAVAYGYLETENYTRKSQRIVLSLNIGLPIYTHSG